MAKSKKTTPVAEVVESRMARAGDPAGATTFSLSQVPGSVTESIVKPRLTVDNMFNQTHTFEQLDNDFIAQSRANYKINPRLFFNYNSSMLVHTINRIPLIEGSIDTEIENNDDTKLTYDFSSNTYIPSNGGKASSIPTERASYKNQDVIQYKNTTVNNSSLVSGDVVNKVNLVNREIQSNLGLTVSRSEMSHFKNLEAYGEFGDSTISKSLFMKPEYSIRLNSDSSLGTKTSGYRRLSADFNSSYMPMYFGVDDYSIDGRDEVNGFKHKKMNYNIYTKYFTNRYFSSTDVEPVLHFNKGATADDLERPNDTNVSTEIISKTGDDPQYNFWRHTPRTANVPKNNYESHTILLADSNKYLDREFGVMTLLFSPSVSTESGVMKDVNYLGIKRRFFTENKSGLGVSSLLRPNDLLGSFPSYQFLSETTSMTSAMALNKGGPGWPIVFDRYEFLKGSNGYGYNNGDNEVPWVSVYPNDNLEVLIEGDLKSSMCLVNDDIYSYIYNKTSNPNNIFMNHLMVDIGPSIDMRNYLMVRDSKSVAHIEDVPWIDKPGGPRKKEYLVYSTSYMSHHGSINVLMYSHIQTDFGCIYIYNPSDGAFPRRPLIDMGTTTRSNAQSWEFDSSTYNLDSSRVHSDEDFMSNCIVFVKKEGLHVTGKTGYFKQGSNPVLVTTSETFPLTDPLRLQAYTKLNSSLDGNSSYGGSDILRYGIPSLITSRSSVYPYNAIVSYVTDRYDSLMSYPGAGVFTFAGTMINPVSLFNTPFNNAINYRLGFNPSHRAGQGLSMLCENQNATVLNNSTGVNYLNTTTDSYAGFGNNAPYVAQKTNMKTIVGLTTNASYSKYSLYRPLLKKIVERSTRAREDIINASIIDVKKKKSFFDPVDNQLYLSTVVPKSESHLPIDNLLVPSERFSNIYARYETNISFIGTRDFNMQQGDNGDFYTYTSLQKDVLGIKFEYMLDPIDDRYVDVHYGTGIKTRTFPNGGSFDLTNPITEINTTTAMVNALTVGDVVPVGEVRSYGVLTSIDPDSGVKSKSLFNDTGVQLVLGEDRYSTSKGFFSLFRWEKFEDVCELVLMDNTGGSGVRQNIYVNASKYNQDDRVSFTGSYGNELKQTANFKALEKVTKKTSRLIKRVNTNMFNMDSSLALARKLSYVENEIKECYSDAYFNGSNASNIRPSITLDILNVSFSAASAFFFEDIIMTINNWKNGKIYNVKASDPKVQIEDRGSGVYRLSTSSECTFTVKISGDGVMTYTSQALEFSTKIMNITWPQPGSLVSTETEYTLRYSNIDVSKERTTVTLNGDSRGVRKISEGEYAIKFYQKGSNVLEISSSVGLVSREDIFINSIFKQNPLSTFDRTTNIVTLEGVKSSLGRLGVDTSNASAYCTSDVFASLFKGSVDETDFKDMSCFTRGIDNDFSPKKVKDLRISDFHNFTRSYESLWNDSSYFSHSINEKERNIDKTITTQNNSTANLYHKMYSDRVSIIFHSDDGLKYDLLHGNKVKASINYKRGTIKIRLSFIDKATSSENGEFIYSINLFQGLGEHFNSCDKQIECGFTNDDLNLIRIDVIGGTKKEENYFLLESMKGSGSSIGNGFMDILSETEIMRENEFFNEISPTGVAGDYTQITVQKGFPFMVSIYKLDNIFINGTDSGSSPYVYKGSLSSQSFHPNDVLTHKPDGFTCNHFFNFQCENRKEGFDCVPYLNRYYKKIGKNERFLPSLFAIPDPRPYPYFPAFGICFNTNNIVGRQEYKSEAFMTYGTGDLAAAFMAVGYYFLMSGVTISSEQESWDIGVSDFTNLAGLMFNVYGVQMAYPVPSRTLRTCFEVEDEELYVYRDNRDFLKEMVVEFNRDPKVYLSTILSDKYRQGGIKNVVFKAPTGEFQTMGNGTFFNTDLLGNMEFKQKGYYLYISFAKSDLFRITTKSEDTTNGVSSYITDRKDYSSTDLWLPILIQEILVK